MADKIERLIAEIDYTKTLVFKEKKTQAQINNENLNREVLIEEILQWPHLRKFVSLPIPKKIFEIV